MTRQEQDGVYLRLASFSVRNCFMKRGYEVLGGTRPTGEPREGICGYCGKSCGSRAIDEGIGSYDYGSIRGVHHEWVWVSDCCEAEVLDFPDEDDKEDEEETDDFE